MQERDALSKVINLFSDYVSGITVARKMGGLSFFQAGRSVLRARLRYGIGPRFHSLFELHGKPEADWQNYLLDEPLKVIFRRLNPAVNRKVVDDKLAFHEHCASRDIDVIPLVCAIDRGGRESPGGAYYVRDAVHWCELIDAGPDELFLKYIDGTWGIGAFGAKRQADGTWMYCGSVGSTMDFYAFVIDRMEGQRGWIVQPRIRPHPLLQEIMSPFGLGTFRVVTALKNGVPSILFAVLRLPVGRNAADNFVHGTSGNLIAAVDVESGKLSCGRASASRAWPNIVDADFHPESGRGITGRPVPFWEDLKDIVVRAHLSLPSLVTLGWDVAVTEQGPLIVEANGTYDVDLAQVALKKGVRPDLDFLLKLDAQRC